jgi:hypothetical protein
MACSCNKNKAGTAKPKSYTVTAKDGSKKSYSTEVEAAAAARRLSGSYKAA